MSPLPLLISPGSGMEIFASLWKWGNKHFPREERVHVRCKQTGNISAGKVI